MSNEPIIQAGLLEQTLAAAGQMQLTGADRELIKKRIGEIDPSKSFTEVVRDLLDKTPDVSKAEGKGDKRQFTLGSKKRARSLPRMFERVPAVIQRETPEKEENQPVVEQILAKRDEELDELYSYIHEAIKEKLKDPESISRLILRSKNARIILGYYLSEVKEIRLEDIKIFARELDLDLSKWDLEKAFTGEDSKKIDLLTDISIGEKEALLRKLRHFTTKAIFILDNQKKLELKEVIKKINIDLLQRGVTVHEIFEVVEESKRLAWLKSIMILKKMHLKRLLSSSRDEFDRYSRLIATYTLAVRNLGMKISEKGARLVENSLAYSSYKAAKYKLELLGSMQSLNFEKDREKHIEWLKELVDELSQAQ
ncbi:MAG: hypothetical protein ABIJ26_04590 [Candidatus Margulisiibacteriota bacterium]